MSLKGKNVSKKETSTKKSSAVVSDSVGNYEKHPFFIKKAKSAKALLLKVGLPKQLTKRAHA
ncbi:MAG TPA: hypothetical protein VMV20_02880 [Chitinophagaceae bacterium]|nr:hypothetical protein [Chitinophagaceae bacterium]